MVPATAPRPAPVPEAVPPILAVDGELPTGAWAYEFKWDGYRCCLRVAADGGTRLTSRNGNDLTAVYPELAGGALREALRGRDAVLDGEIVALNDAGRPDFGLLQRRHQRAPSPGRLAGVPVTFFAFDLPRLDGHPLLRAPYEERRALLAEIGSAADPAAARLAVPPHYSGPGAFPEELLRVAAEHTLEGLVAKRLGSPYHPGRRSPLWVKKPLVSTQEAVIGGWQPGAGRRAGRVGSLLLGAHDAEGTLRFIGHVGSGLGAATLADLAARLAPLARATSPFGEPVPREHARTARWVEPRLVADVAFRRWTGDRRLRQPSWRGLRLDRDPESVALPPP
ncbi:non-homologous end-joining DNA ligase [Streptomyces sp. DSM 44917]|uniref:DNA ligase (ATP) n=1 Tax=Streptomyces boetiae TaxID=3075541 RepID=A0ABU2LB85_9ACTN|nr:non-homologous end-joining DNA ligase [Streptomyces sp. DSM 44917]MDT0308840.1 non-homologous end-joining DNA ligase [Streptomyces sp. DSM 44917]